MADTVFSKPVDGEIASLSGNITNLSGHTVNVVESQYTLNAGSDFVYQPVGTNRVLLSAYINGWDSDALMVKGIALLNTTNYGIFFNKSLSSSKTIKVRCVWLNSSDVIINY